MTLALSLQGCFNAPPQTGASTAAEPTAAPSPTVPVASPIAVAVPANRKSLLQESWNAYRQRFVQPDGRIIDREAEDRSTSEGQAYAMLRAVMIDDRATFDRAFQWAENNLQRTENGKRTDSLWAWKWGKDKAGRWGTIDANFASDADIDAVTALILAARRWQEPKYLELARPKLQDLWNISTVSDLNNRQVRYLLPGPAAAFQKQTLVQLNPSYFAPYAFRLFAQVDPERNWLSLVDSSYQVLQQAAALSTVGLPNDWIVLNINTGRIEPQTTPPPGTSEYGFDAYRVWWRVAWDALWFGEARAQNFLQKYTRHPKELWRSQRKIPARIDLQGKPLVPYEATSQYAMLYPAFLLTDPAIAGQIEQKLMAQYRDGFWDNDRAYYSQNLAWLALATTDMIAPFLKAP